MPALRTLVVIPPMTQLNCPYASLPTCCGILTAAGHQATPWDASLDLALRIFSRSGVERLMAAVAEQGVPAGYEEVVLNAPRYARVIEAVIAFLQGRDNALAQRIVRQAWLPQGPRFAGGDAEAEARAFGEQGLVDQARWLCTLLLQDLADCWRASISPDFGLTSYAAQVAMSASSYDGLAAKLASPPDPIEALLLEACLERIPTDLDLLVVSAPFPGNLPSALRIAQWCRAQRPQLHIALGGGYPSTELRRLSDPRIFDLVDSILLDAGEDSLPALCANLQDATAPLCRCFRLGDDGQPRFHDQPGCAAGPSTPRYDDIALDRYLDLIDTWNPVQRLWNEGRWLKTIAAHGCYWKRCSFCDTSLPYIADYRAKRAGALADEMDALAATTGQRGFHLCDEAAPPSLLLALALELLARGRSYSWWGNIRFDPYFTPDRCRVLAAAGMIAVTGGLETANDRILPRIAKGVSVAQAAQVGRAFAEAGILVHAYLMYGFPGETEQDSIDSLEAVRQLMLAGCIHSGFWHRFTCTAHSPVGRDPAAFEIEITGPPFAGFAWNNLEHREPANDCDHDAIGAGLAAAMAHWLQGIGLEEPLQTWFDRGIPTSALPDDHIVSALDLAAPAAGERLRWLGEAPQPTDDGLLLSDECGDCHLLPLPAAIADLLAQAMAADKRQLPLVADHDPDLLAALRPLGLCQI